MTTWNNDLELQFLEHYQGAPVLWDAKHRYYKDKNQNNDAWFRISSLMGISVAVLKKKRDSLLSSYRKYRKMVRDSMHSGAGTIEVYKPVWFAFELMDSFLGEGHTCKQTINTISNIGELSQGEEEIQENDEHIVATSQASSSSHTEPPTKRRCKNPPELQEAGSLLKQAISSLDVALKKKDPHEDMCDLYGKILAVKLRQLPEVQRLQFMHEIDGMFLRNQFIPSRAPKYNYVESPAPSLASSYYGSINQPNSVASYHSDGSTRASFEPDINTENDGGVIGSSQAGPLIIIQSNDVLGAPKQQSPVQSQDIICNALLNANI